MATLREITESEATGEIARIYEEIREAYAAPYVSSLFRHLATYPGLLEWAWGFTRPAFVSGLIQHTGWDHVDVSALPALPPLSRDDLRALGVTGADEGVIRDVCRTFTRVSPINLVFAGCLARVLRDEAGMMASVAAPSSRPLPEDLPQLPSMVPWEELGPERRAVVDVFETELAGEAFVPGLYRILAHWPGYLARVAVVLGLACPTPGFWRHARRSPTESWTRRPRFSPRSRCPRDRRRSMPAKVNSCSPRSRPIAAPARRWSVSAQCC